jgi:5-methylcytosine-specific restriction endonuclease McrA
MGWIGSGRSWTLRFTQQRTDMKKLVLDLWHRRIVAPFWQLKRRIVYIRDRGYCGYCGDKLSIAKFTVDHVVPRRHGGSNRLKNLRTCCTYCNKIKGDAHPVTQEMRDYMWHRAFQRHQCNSARERKKILT